MDSRRVCIVTGIGTANTRLAFPSVALLGYQHFFLCRWTCLPHWAMCNTLSIGMPPRCHLVPAGRWYSVGTMLKTHTKHLFSVFQRAWVA